MSDSEKYKWKVRVYCLTYNHALYIVDALNGFTMQQTDFPFVCVIVDDASADGEPQILQQYLEKYFGFNSSVTRCEETDDYTMIFTQHLCNRNCYFAVYFLKYNHYSLKKSKLPYIAEWSNNAKYHALCEGDDYWTDMNKLQRQVDFLESHPAYSAISENGMELFMESGRKALFSEEPPRIVPFSELIEKRRFPTASVLYKKDAIDKRYYLSKYKIDTILWCSLASKGSIYYNAINSSVYRRGPGITVTTPPFEFAQLQESWHKELHMLFPEYYDSKKYKTFLIRSYIAAANIYLKRYEWRKDICYCFIKAVRISPFLFINVFISQYVQVLKNLCHSDHSLENNNV